VMTLWEFIQDIDQGRGQKRECGASQFLLIQLRIASAG
jgi:hypothetical protein